MYEKNEIAKRLKVLRAPSTVNLGHLGVVEQHELRILESIEKNYDDLEDFLNISLALSRIQSTVINTLINHY